MKILVVGSGAREHTLVWKLAQSPKTEEIYAAPGNAGTAQLAQNLDIKAEDIEGLFKAAQEKKVELVVVGPEVPLAEGIVDRFQTTGILIFGPTKAATEIESSKAFAKELMLKYKIPCAKSVTFSNYQQAKEYIEGQQPPIVIKADGLAAGKGVIIAESTAQAQESLSSIMEDKTLGTAGETVVIEEHLSGREMSAFAFSDGQTVLPLAYACDYKRIDDGDRGPNTGGMGSYSPPHFKTAEMAETVEKTIMEPAVAAMSQENRDYSSILYGGLMITREGPKVIEFNARLGDPETQVILPLLKTDLIDVILATINGCLDEMKIEISNETCVGVVMASDGYPASAKTGFPISGLDTLDDGVEVFHAGTKLANDGQILTSGGRVLTVTAMGKTLAEARKKVYANISRINFEGAHYRRDIALIKEN